LLGDLNIAEPNALIGFAAHGHRADHPAEAPRGFQRFKFLLQHGFLDAIVPRTEMKAYLQRSLDWMTVTKQ